jgi:hypothetical protein
MAGPIHHHHARHARTAGSAPEQAPAGLPERFLPLLTHAEKVAMGKWTDPALEDMIVALRRDFGRWQREQRQA